MTDQPDKIVRRLVAPTDLGEHHRLLNRLLIAEPPPVGLGQIGLRMRFGQVAAHLLMREHAIERFGETRGAAQLLVGLLGEAAADQRAAGPVMRSGSKVGIGRSGGAALEGFGSLVAIAQPPRR